MTQCATLWGGDKSEVVNHMGYRLPRGGVEGGREGQGDREREREGRRVREISVPEPSCLGDALGT